MAGRTVREEVLRAGDLPLPGDGATGARLDGLASLGGRDLSTARLAEGHADALAILAEAGGVARPGLVYGVWAAKSGRDVAAARRHDGWTISGCKTFCSGASLCDRALLVVSADGGDLLFDVDLRQGGIVPVGGTWPAVGMAGSDSRSVLFEGVRAEADEIVGEPGFYTARPGFSHGGVGVAAVWFGGARALVRATAAALGSGAGDGELAALGVAVAHVEAMDAVLHRAAQGIDSDPGDARGGARRRALVTRQAVHSSATAVLAATASAGGARPLCLDGPNAQRAADLYVYLAQHHPGRDGAALGRLAAGDPLLGDPLSGGPSSSAAGGSGEQP